MKLKLSKTLFQHWPNILFNGGSEIFGWTEMYTNSHPETCFFKCFFFFFLRFFFFLQFFFFITVIEYLKLTECARSFRLNPTMLFVYTKNCEDMESQIHLYFSRITFKKKLKIFIVEIYF